jgi:hypothetical protein
VWVTANTQTSTNSVKRLAIDSLGIYVTGAVEIIDTGGNSVINSTTGSNGNTNLQLDFPDVSTAIARLQLFRFTNTSGTREMVIFRGDNSTTRDHTFTANGGYLSGGATGGDKGVGTINISGDVYKNNTAYTNPDYALEMWRDGRIEQFRNNPGAATYERLSLEAVEGYIRQHLKLPGFTNEPVGMFDRADLVLEKLEELYTHVIEIHHRLEALER